MNPCWNKAKISADVPFLDSLTERICETYRDNAAVNHNEGRNLPRESEVLVVLGDLMEIVFPGIFGREAYPAAMIKYSVGNLLARINQSLTELLVRSLRYEAGGDAKECEFFEQASSIARRLLESLPDIREMMKLDMQAAYEGDPAARGVDEVVLSYPCLKALTIHRIAHRLHELKAPHIPRMMNEYAHRITGIDIHPGATIGKGAFIDHGTGVVIGETTEIGDNVKIYQGVTLGALSFPRDACGMIIKHAKRHPTIEDDVTIYAGATILGPITVGRGSVIGGNVWLTESVEPGTRITIAPPELTINKKTPRAGSSS